MTSPIKSVHKASDIDRKLPYLTSQEQEHAIAVSTFIEGDTQCYKKTPLRPTHYDSQFTK